MAPNDEIFQELVLDHSRHPRRVGRLAVPPALHGSGQNPACGDEVEIWVEVTLDQRLKAINFMGQGCAISQATASLLAVSLQGKSLEEVGKMLKSFGDMLRGENTGEGLGSLQFLSAVIKFPARVACAQVAPTALQRALGDMLTTARPD